MLKFLFTLFVTLFAILFHNNFWLWASEDSMILYGNELELEDNIVLTIDDVSIEANIRIMFDLLNNINATATIFPNTRYLNHQDPNLWQQMIANGFEIGYHTRNHTSYMTPDELNADYDLFLSEIRTILNDPAYDIKYVRPPNGTWNQNWIMWAKSRGLLTIRWNITSATEDINYIENVLLNRKNGGSIILLHTDINDVQWLQNNLSQLIRLQDEQGNFFHITNLSNALAA